MSCSEILKTLEIMNKKITRIENKLDSVIQSNNKLETHIEFVDSVYTSLRKPLDFVSRKFGGGELNDKDNMLENDK